MYKNSFNMNTTYQLTQSEIAKKRKRNIGAFIMWAGAGAFFMNYVLAIISHRDPNIWFMLSAMSVFLAGMIAWYANI